jgi:RNA polymerase sigma factor (sigma-70 family)
MLTIDDWLPIVHKEARRLKRKIPQWMEYNDLVGAGTIGILQAAKLHRTDGQLFKIYASFRTRGEMIDEMRRFYRVSKANRKNPNEYFFIDEYDRKNDDPSQEELYMLAETIKITNDILSKLSKRGLTIITLFYKHKVPMKEIGRRIGVNESRVSQLLKSLLLDIKTKIEDA